MSRSRTDLILVWWLRGCATVSAAVVVFIGAFVLREAWPGLREVGISRFVADDGWYPTAAEARYGMWPMVAASLWLMVGSVLLATPLGVASAVFCQWYAPRPVAAVYRRVVELLAGIPSVVYGFWGLVTLVPLIARWQPPGSSLLAGVLILAVMVLPTVALLSEAALASVPKSYERGAEALGMGRWATLRRVVLPAARPGITTAVLLAAGRAIGETMAVLMVCGNVVQVPGSVFAPVRALTSNIALEMSYAMADHRAVLFVSGAVLLGVVTVLVVAAEWMSRGDLRLTTGGHHD